jgi:hypothetical protein
MRTTTPRQMALHGVDCEVEEGGDAASDIADPASPAHVLMRKEAVKTAVSRFAALPTLQRSVASSLRTCVGR